MRKTITIKKGGKRGIFFLENWGFLIKIAFFFCPIISGLPAGSGVLASQGDQPKKGEKFFFFAPCCVWYVALTLTLRYVTRLYALRTLPLTTSLKNVAGGYLQKIEAET